MYFNDFTRVIIRCNIKIEVKASIWKWIVILRGDKIGLKSNVFKEEMMESRITDHKNINLEELHKKVIRGEADGQVIWQPRILCWYDDKMFNNDPLPEPYDGMSLTELYRTLGCSNRIYDYNGCFKKNNDSRVKASERKLSDMETEYRLETPVGTISTIYRSNDSNSGVFPSKWWVTTEDELKIATWIEEHCTWIWDEEHYQKTREEWGNLGMPTIFMPRVNIMSLYLDTMGVQEAVYALMDYPETVEKHFKALDESHERLIDVINTSKIDVINFGDNLHSGTLPGYYFEKYVLPAYKRRNELLHQANKFTYAHWDGDTKGLLPYAKECGLDGIEAITPKPQGDVTLEEIKEALGDEVFLIDGIAAVLFDDIYPEEQLVEQVNQLIDLFAPKLVLGISDEMSSTGNIERIQLVRQIVDDYNAKVLMKDK